MGRGRGRGKRSFSRDNRNGRGGEWDADKKQRTGWNDTVQEHPAFEEYYRAQNVCPPDEWDAFLGALRRQLPLTFRINGGGRFAHNLREKLETDFLSDFASGPIIIDGEVINPPKPLPWYPNKLAWQLEFSRTQLRKIPKLESLHEFMKRETDVGSITRQEAVSMVPPLFLDVHPSHRVLDMCAAPGSKTAQLLESMHANGAIPTGVVVANDADTQRCNMLTHQTQRIRSPALVVCNHEAQNFPLLWDLDPASTDHKIMYDRILCDVPCSGDGTIRKQPDIWRRWNSGGGNGLHILQLRITLRACELLKVGGRLVYSTCTFNPIEDEAVVAEVLRRTGGSMELLDVSGELPELKRCSGLEQWRVRDKDGKWYSTWEEGKEGYKLDPSMFPGPGHEGLPLQRCMRFLPHHQDTGGFFVAVLKKVKNLEKIQYPTIDHRADQGRAAKRAAQDAAAAAAVSNVPIIPDVTQTAGLPAVLDPAPVPVAVVEATEGAGVAVLGDEDVQRHCLKTSRAPPEKVLPEWGGARGGGSRNRTTTEGEAPGEATTTAKPNNGGGRWRGIDPIVPMVDGEIVNSIRVFYGLGPDCPVPTHLIARSNDARPKKLTYINSGAKLLLQMDIKEQIKVTAAGVKMFDRQDNRDNILSCSYRVAQEGLASLLPYVTRQRFQPTIQELLHILKDRMVGLPASCKVHITKGKDAEAVDHGEVGAEAQAPAGDEEDEAKVEGAVEVNKEESADGEAASLKKLRAHLSDAHTLQQLSATEYGCCIATLRRCDLVTLGFAESDEEGQAAEDAEAMFAVACWRGRGNLNVLVSKQECAQMAERLEAAALAAKRQA